MFRYGSIPHFQSLLNGYEISCEYGQIVWFVVKNPMYALNWGAALTD